MVFGFTPKGKKRKKRKAIASFNSECFTGGCIDFSCYCRSVRGNWIGNCRNTVISCFGICILSHTTLCAFWSQSRNRTERALMSEPLSDCSDFGFSNITVLQCKRLRSPLWIETILLCIYGRPVSFSFPAWPAFGVSFAFTWRALGQILLDCCVGYFAFGEGVRYGCTDGWGGTGIIHIHI